MSAFGTENQELMHWIRLLNQPIQLGAFFTAWTSAAMAVFPPPGILKGKQLQKIQKKNPCKIDTVSGQGQKQEHPKSIMFKLTLCYIIPSPLLDATLELESELRNDSWPSCHFAMRNFACMFYSQTWQIDWTTCATKVGRVILRRMAAGPKCSKLVLIGFCCVRCLFVASRFGLNRFVPCCTWLETYLRPFISSLPLFALLIFVVTGLDFYL